MRRGGRKGDIVFLCEREGGSVASVKSGKEVSPVKGSGKLSLQKKKKGGKRAY